MPTAKCFLMTSNGKDGWGSPTLQAFSAVESFRAALAMWKLHLCLKWSKRCRGQASVAFTRCRRNLSRSGPHPCHSNQTLHALLLGSHWWGCNCGSYNKDTTGETPAVWCRKPLRCWRSCQEVHVWPTHIQTTGTAQRHLQATKARETTWPVLDM